MFRARASLSAAAMLSIVGLAAMGLGIFMLQRGMQFYVELAGPRFTWAMIALGILFTGLGASSLTAGIRSVEMFERKLLLTISSRGTVTK